jgi:hypothetical protein
MSKSLLSCFTSATDVSLLPHESLIFAEADAGDCVKCKPTEPWCEVNARSDIMQMTDQFGDCVINMLFVSQDTVRAESWMQKALQSCSFLIISDGEKRRNLFAID